MFSARLIFLSFIFFPPVLSQDLPEIKREQIKTLFKTLANEKPAIKYFDSVKEKFRKRTFYKEYYNFYFPNGTFHHSESHHEKNMLSGFHCFDHTRVVLSKEFANSSDYINANYVDGYKQSRKFILTQGENM